MAEWQESRLGLVAHHFRGYSYSSAELSEDGDDFISLKVFDKGGGFRVDGVKAINGPVPQRFRVPAGAVLVANTDLTRDGDVVGVPAVVPPQFDGAVFSMDATRCVPDSDLLDDRFLALALSTPEVRAFMRGSSAGSTVLHLDTSRLDHVPLPLPPLEEQQRIAEILDTIDETIQTTERVIAKLVVVARATQDRLVSSASSGRSVMLASIAALIGGHGFPEDEQGHQSGSLPFYKVSDMNRTGNEKFLDKANNYVQPETAERNGWRVLPPGAVVFAKVGAALLSNRRRILRVRSIIDNNMMAAVPRQVVSTGWLYRWLQTVDFARFVQVGALPSVNQGLVGSLRLDLPTLCEQERQTDVLDAHDSRINTEIAQLAKYKRIRAGLATDLLSGRVRTVAA